MKLIMPLKKIQTLRMFKALKIFTQKTFSIIDGFSEMILRRIKISLRLIASFLLLSLIPLVLVGIMAVSMATGAMRENISKYSEQIVNQIQVDFFNEMNKIEDISLKIMLSKELSEYSQREMMGDEIEKLEKFKALSDYVTSIPFSASNVKDVALYSDDDGLFMGTPKLFDPFEYKKDEIYKKASATPKKTLWLYIGENKQNSIKLKSFVFFRVLSDINTNQEAGFLQIIPKADFFRKIYEDIDLGKGSNIFIIDDQNTIVSSKDSNNTGKSIDEILPVSKSLNEAAGTSKDKGNKGVLWHNSAGKTMMVCYSANPGTNWKVVGIVPFDSLMQKTNAIFYVVTMLIIICALASLLISYMVTRSVTLPMGRISHSVEALKNGDFTKLLDVKFNDEISKFAEGFNRMISDIRAIIVDVHKSAENVVKSSDTIATHSQHAAASATQIAKAIQDMSEGSSEQAFEAQKGKEIMGALADNLNVVVENTSLVQDAAYEARNLSQNSLKVVDDLNSKAKETGLATDSIVSLINDLNSDMKQITNIVKVSVGISEQTNLLSLNAAIEAARAGDAGKGFAVVAEEVKKLADKSKAASVSISSIINSIVAKTNYMVEAAQNASKAIDKQMDAVVHTEKAFKTILDSTDNMVIQIERVNRLIRDMDELKAKAVCLMDRISEISEASAAASEEIGATTQEQISAASILADLADSLNEMAGSLEKTIAHFKV